jgi:hypothetical protein
MLWGGTGTGKSMIALTVALGAAGGGAAFGWTFPSPAKVLYVDGEQSERDLKKRLGLLPSGISGFNAAQAAANFVVMARAAQSEGTKFLDIGSPAQAEMFAAEIRRQGFGLVVFDNLSTLSDSIEDENSAAAFKPMQVLLTRLKKLNVAVILVHHSGKDPSGYRGSSSIATTFERILGIVRSEAAPSTKIDVVVTLEKFRDEIPEGFQPVFPLRFSTVEKDGKRLSEWEVGQLGRLEEAWRMYNSGRYASKEHFVDAYNERFGETRAASNFGRDFTRRWIAELGKSEKEIKRAVDLMKLVQECEADDESAKVGEADF